MPDAPLTPECPLCGTPPVIMLSGSTQAFCGNDNCTLILWNPSLTLDENLLDAGVIRFPPAEAGRLPGDEPREDEDSGD